MKYKYIVSLLVALGFSNAFAAEEEVIDPSATAAAEDIPGGGFQGVYNVLTSKKLTASQRINGALDDNQAFNHKDITDDIILSSQTGLALRKAVIGLNAANLQAVVEENPEFFKTSLGVSLVYGWTLNQFKEPITPYYIGDYFSFDKLFQGLANKMTDSQVRTFLKSTFTRGLTAVEAERWAFYDHMLYLPYAIEQVRHVETFVDNEAESPPKPTDEDSTWRLVDDLTLSIDEVVRMSRCTKEEAKTETLRVPGIAAHLQGDPGDFINNWEARNFVGLQKCTIQEPAQCSRINTIALAVFQSLPADTDEDYVFMGSSLKAHTDTFRRDIHMEYDYNLISHEDYMNYEGKKESYPKTTSDPKFVNFCSMIAHYSEELSGKKNKLEGTITFLINQNKKDNPLHEPDGLWALWGNDSKLKRDAIAKLLQALRTILKPIEA